MKRAGVVARAIDPASLIAEVRSPQVGAIPLFLGTVRDTNDGRTVTGLDYSAYTAMAESEMAEILSEAGERFGVDSIVVEHRVGALRLEDISIAIVAAHAHRQPAMACTRFVIDEIKKRVPIWKREHYVDGTTQWVDPTHESGASAL